MPQEKDMPYIPMEDLLKQIDSRYKLVILASRRAVELSLSGSGQRLVDINPRAKVSTIALEEIREGKIGYKRVESSK